MEFLSELDLLNPTALGQSAVYGVITFILIKAFKWVTSMYSPQKKSVRPDLHFKQKFQREFCMFLLLMATIYLGLTFLSASGIGNAGASRRSLLPEITFTNCGVMGPYLKNPQNPTPEDLEQAQKAYQSNMGKEREVDIQIGLRVFNKGKPTVLHGWELVVIPERGSALKTELVFPAPLGVTFVSERGRPPMQLFGKDYLADTVRTTPIPTGAMAEGWLSFVVPNVTKQMVGVPGTKVVLTFKDVDQNPYKLEHVIATQQGVY